MTVLGFPANNPSDFEFLTRLQNGTYKLTYQLTPNNRLGHYIQMGRKLQPHRGAGSTRLSGRGLQAGQLFLRRQCRLEQRRQPCFLFQYASSGVRYNWPNLPYGTDGGLNQNLALRRFDNGTGNTAGASQPTRNDRRRLQFDWTGTVYRDAWAGGNHSLKFGVVSEREGQDYRDEGYLGHYRTLYDTDSGNDFTTPYRVQIYNTPQQDSNWSWHHGAFVNDQLQKGRVTLNLGVRWDYYSLVLPGSGDSRRSLQRLLLRWRGAPQRLPHCSNAVCGILDDTGP